MPSFSKIVAVGFLFLAIGVPCAHAQTLERAYIIVEPLQYSNQGKFRGCGLNMKVLQETEAKSRDYVTVSVNFWLESPGAALLKTTLSRATLGPSPSVSSQPLDSSWIRLKGADPLSPTKSFAGEDSALLAIVDLSPAIVFVTSVLQGNDEVQVGFKQHTAKYERVFYGTPKVEEESRALLQACFDEFISRLDNQPKR